MLEGQEAARPPGVHRGALGGGQEDGLLGQAGDGVAVGDDNGQCAVAAARARGAQALGDHLGEQRVLPPGPGDLQVHDAGLRVVGCGHGGGAAQGLGGDLGPQADGHGGDALGDDLGQEPTQRHDPGVVVLAVGAHGAPQHHQGAVDLLQGGDGVARTGADHADGGALGEQPLPQAPERRQGLGLNDGNDRCAGDGTRRGRAGRGLPGVGGRYRVLRGCVGVGHGANWRGRCAGRASCRHQQAGPGGVAPPCCRASRCRARCRALPRCPEPTTAGRARVGRRGGWCRAPGPRGSQPGPCGDAHEKGLPTTALALRMVLWTANASPRLPDTLTPCPPALLSPPVS